MSCLYSNNFPVLSSNISANSLLLSEFLGRNGLLVHAAYMHSYIIVTCFVFDCMFDASPSTSVSWVNGVIVLGRLKMSGCADDWCNVDAPSDTVILHFGMGWHPWM